MSKLLLKIQCIECSCVREITDKQVPSGDCSACTKDFGWYFAPKTMPNLELKHGDFVIVNTRVPVDSSQRIFSVRRKNGKMAYVQPAGETA